MKKIYLQPDIEVYNIKLGTICTGSFGASNGDNTITGGGNLGNASTDGTTQLSRDDDSMWDDDDNE